MVTFRTLSIAACGWVLACDAAALTLGRPRGAALIGRPLEVSIPVTLDQAAADGPCASGELYYGEQKVAAAPDVRWLPGRGAEGSLRVTSQAPVDEPMVTLYLRVGCGQTSTRRYVLLAELPAEVEPGAAAPRIVPLAAAPLGAAPASRAARPDPQATPTDPRMARTEAGAAGTGPRREAKPAPAAPTRPAAKQEPVRPQARLKVEPVAPGPERDPVLRLTSELGAQVATDPQRRLAAAALWQALQKGPEQALQDTQRVQSVERELQSLRDVTRQNAGAVSQMRAQVEQARSERQSASLLVLVLTALLAVLLGWFAWRWYRLRQVDRVGQWFDANADTAHATLAVPHPVARPDASSPPSRPAASPAVAAAATAAATAPAAAAQAGTAPKASAAARASAAAGPISVWAPAEEFQASRGGSVRMVGVEELIDVHDKADFFLSIGQVDQAIAVLEAHVHDQVETSALVWMDLLNLYHSQGRRVEYARLHSEFLQRFAVEVPDYEHFDQPTASLENYSRALSRIVALWPSRKVLDVIEESIFRKPGLPGADPFSLEAYRDLVLLYHIAKEVAPAQEPRRRARSAAGFADTAMQPLNMVERPEPTAYERERLMIPPASTRLGVDIDLAAAPAQEAPEVEPFDLPALDFDISSYDDLDDGDGAAKRKRG